MILHCESDANKNESRHEDKQNPSNKLELVHFLLEDYEHKNESQKEYAELNA